jgi:putative effector of murein hydrolase LrgA (UPF0299 family)
MDKKPVTVGPKEGLGSGVIGIGLIMFFLPTMVQRIADLDFIESSAFGILSGAILVLSVFIVAGGLAVIVGKFDEEE